MSNQLLPSSAREGNTLGFRLAQQTFTPSSHNNPASINKYFGSGWAFGPCPETVDAAIAIGGGRVGDIVPTDECSFHLVVTKIPESGGSRAHRVFTFSSVTSSDVVQSETSTGGFAGVSIASRAFVPGWDGAAPTSGTELWALRSGRWLCEIDYSYTDYTGNPPIAGRANVDLMFKTLATTIGNQSQSALPSSHPLSTTGTVNFTETVDLLAHPLWLPRYNALAGAGGSTYDAIADDTVWFEVTATFERLGLAGT